MWERLNFDSSGLFNPFTDVSARGCMILAQPTTVLFASLQSLNRRAKWTESNPFPSRSIHRATINLLLRLPITLHPLISQALRISTPHKHCSHIEYVKLQNYHAPLSQQSNRSDNCKVVPPPFSVLPGWTESSVTHWKSALYVESRVHLLGSFYEHHAAPIESSWIAKRNKYI